jgi:hypothetical protein
MTKITYTKEIAVEIFDKAESLVDKGIKDFKTIEKSFVKNEKGF